jgi:hypothetical protein
MQHSLRHLTAQPTKRFAQLQPVAVSIKTSLPLSEADEN